MWFSWCFVYVVVIGVKLSSAEDDEPTTPRPPPPLPFKNFTEYVKISGYEAVEHEVTAPDGQKLTMFNLKPKKPGGPVAILVHAAIMAADAWCLKKDSLGYLLADKGVDVWLPPLRGNVYGRKHAKLNPDTDKEFWDFSFEKMGETDLPAVIDYVLEKTKQPNAYLVAYSAGTSVSLIALSKKPEYNAKIKELILLAPIWHCTKFQFMVNKESSIYQMVLDTYKQWDDKAKWEGFPRADVPRTEHQLRCGDLPEIATPYCEMGLDMSYNAVGDYLPAGISVKMMKHLGQAYIIGKVLPWDFDAPELNKKAYGQENPPDYDLKKVTTKVHLIWASNDQAIDSKDAEKLASELPNVGVKLEIDDENFNHPDYITPSSPEVNKPYEDLNKKLVEMIK